MNDKNKYTQLNLIDIDSNDKLVINNNQVEESSYYWNNDPVVIQKKEIDSNNLIVVELFCGVGGTSIGFEMAGFNIALCSDIHKPSIETIRQNHPNANIILGDIKKINPNLIKQLLNGRRPDVLIGGVPCQGFSLNNKKRSDDDDRNFLYKEYLKFVQVLNPRSVLLENVSGMKSVGNFVNTIEEELSNASQMQVKSKMLNSEDYGVPQKRKRLIFIGVENKKFDFDRIIKTHGIGKQKYNTIANAIEDLPSLANNQEKKKYNSKPTNSFQKFMRIQSQRLTCHKAPNHPKSTIDRIKNTVPGEPLYEKYRQRIRLSWDSLSPTQVSGGIRAQFQLGHPEDNRGLTIRERCRIQSIPDHIIVQGGLVQSRVQTGNAVPPLLARAIALAIKEYL